MKILMFIATLFFIPHTLLSQSIVNPIKTWSNLHFHYEGFYFSTEYLRVTTDTSIGAYNYKRVEISTDPNQSNWSFYGYARETADKQVYYRLNSQQPEKLLYKLSAWVGDSLLIYSLMNYQSGTFDSLWCHITSIDSVLIGNTFRTQLHLSIRAGSSLLEVGQWVDSVGSISAGMLHNSTGLMGGDGYTLLCFFENTVLKYHLPSYSSCYVVTGISNKSLLPKDGILSPDPLTTVSRIVCPSQFHGKTLILSIYNTSMKRIKQVEFSESIELSRNDFDEGFYLYAILFQGKLVRTGKFVVK